VRAYKFRAIQELLSFNISLSYEIRKGRSVKGVTESVHGAWIKLWLQIIQVVAGEEAVRYFALSQDPPDDIVSVGACQDTAI
jgi:hypothetical protein